MTSIIEYNPEKTRITAHIQPIINDKEKAKELLNALYNVSKRKRTEEIILDMDGIEKIINNGIGTFFGPWFKQAKDNKIKLSLKNASAQVTNKMQQTFRNTINGLSDTLQSDPK